MAAGKPTIGFKLAKKLKFQFIDVDYKIEKNEKEKIIDIFKNKGELYFRKVEEKTTLYYLDRSNCVISIGGGAFLNPKIRKKIKKTSNSVWLNWKFDTILGRISKNKRRPLALNLSKTELAIMFKERVKIYKLSDFKVNCEAKNKNDIIKEILRIITNENNSN